MKPLVNKIYRYLKLYYYFSRQSIMSTTIYRVNSLLGGITPVVWMATTIVFISVIFKASENIGGWSYWQVMLLLGIHELVFLGTWMIFADNLRRFAEELRFGYFDRILILPANHRFLISFNSLDFTVIGSLANVIVVLSLALTHVSLNIDFFRLLTFLVSLGSAYIMVYLIYFILATLSLFWVNSEVYLDWLLEATDFDRYPAEIYSSYFKFFLLFGLPILFFAYVPTAILLGKLPGYFVLWGLLVAGWLYLISTWLWRKGLKKYQSASG